MDATTSTLPGEMIVEEILPRLDVKSLLKFRCVSKPWRALIDSKQFIKTHYQNSMKNQSFPYQRAITQTHDLWPKQCPLLSFLSESNLDPFLPEDRSSDELGSFQVVGCCNGLVCIRDGPTTFIIWNPSTKMTRKLPEVSGNMHATNCGFGWVESSGEYKVFATFYHHFSKKFEAKIYSSKTKSWKAMESRWDYNNPGQVGVLVGEKLHYCFYEESGEITTSSICFLDLKSEVFGRIETPTPRWNSWYSYCVLFGVLGDRPCVVLFDYSGENLVEVWVVKDCWERVVRRGRGCGRVLELLRQPGSASSSVVGPNGEILVFFRLAVFVYHPQDNEFRVLDKYTEYRSHYLCIESLELP